MYTHIPDDYNENRTAGSACGLIFGTDGDFAVITDATEWRDVTCPECIAKDDLPCCDTADATDGRSHDHDCDNYDGAPTHQWEVTTPDAVYATDDEPGDLLGGAKR